MTDKRALNGGLDDYYTNPKYARHCCKVIERETRGFEVDTIVEPSAGNGSFIHPIKEFLNKDGSRSIELYDLEPKHKDIHRADFFETALTRKSMVVGNPPFGFAASLAIKFFNHAAYYNVEVIAFILPKTFQKTSVKTKLNRDYHLIYEEECPKDCFLVDNERYDVPSVFQIWRYSDTQRIDKVWSVDNKWIEFTTQEEAEFCVRRVGGRAGQVLPGNPKDYASVSTYYCKEKIPGAKDALKAIDFSSIVESTAGVRSLSKREIHEQLYIYYKSKNGGQTTIWG